MAKFYLYQQFFVYLLMITSQDIKAIFQELPIGVQNDLLEELLMEQ